MTWMPTWQTLTKSEAHDFVEQKARPKLQHVLRFVCIKQSRYDFKEHKWSFDGILKLKRVTNNTRVDRLATC